MRAGLRHSGSRTPGWLAGALRSGGTGRAAGSASGPAGAKTVSDGRIVVDRGIMPRALYGNLGRFRAAGDSVALVAE